jgi:integrase
MRKKTHRASSGNGSVFWSDAQDRYIGEITLGHDERGRRVRKTIVGPRGFKSEDARLGLKDRLQQFRRKHPPVKRGSLHSRLTLSEYLDTWMGSKVGLSEKSRVTYSWAIEEHIKPGLGRITLRELERKHVRAFFLNLPTLGDGGKAKAYMVLRAALNHAVDEDELIAINPAARLKLEKERRRPDIKVWAPGELLCFLATVKKSEHYPLFLVMVVGALGPAEVFGIRWRDVDLEHKRIIIVANLTECEGRLIYKETKKNERQRCVVLPDIALQALRARYDKLNPSSSDYVFSAPEGGGWRRTNFRTRVWLPLIRKAKVTPITLYALRHSSASLMGALDISIFNASRAVGHGNFATTANVYGHFFPETQRDIAAKLNKFFRGI